jgi:hypothetical protein
VVLAKLVPWSCFLTGVQKHLPHGVDHIRTPSKQDAALVRRTDALFFPPSGSRI